MRVREIRGRRTREVVARCSLGCQLCYGVSASQLDTIFGDCCVCVCVCVCVCPRARKCAFLRHLCACPKHGGASFLGPRGERAIFAERRK